MSEDIMARLISENKALTAEVVRLVRLTDAMRATIEETQQAIRDISHYNAESRRVMTRVEGALSDEVI